MQSGSRIKVAVIASAHGIRGQVKLRSLTENPADISGLSGLMDEAGKPVKLQLHGGQQGYFIASIDGVTDRNAAERLQKQALYVPSSSLPAPENGQWYYGQLVGLEARLPNGSPYGIVKAVQNYGAGDIIECERLDGTEEMLPLRDAFVGEVAPEKGYLVVMPPDYIEPEREA